MKRFGATSASNVDYQVWANMQRILYLLAKLAQSC